MVSTTFLEHCFAC